MQKFIVKKYITSERTLLNVVDPYELTTEGSTRRTKVSTSSSFEAHGLCTAYLMVPVYK